MSSTLRSVIIKQALPAFLLCLFCLGTVAAQTTSFTYQGRLTDAGALANGPYDIEFKLFDNAGLQQGPSVTHEDVAPVDGSFVVVLDFGDVFDGTARFLEIGVRPGDSVDAFTVLNPRWPITSTPYAIRSLKAAASDTAATAATADTATDATQLGGVAADQYVKTDDPRLTAGNLSGSGTTNAIPLWSAGTTLGNSLITQSAAGVQLPNGVQLGVGAQGNRVQFGSPNGETGMTISGVSGRADLRFDGSTLKLATGVVAAGPPDPRNGIVINMAGNVGIGTTTPQSKMVVNAGGRGGEMQFGTPGGESGMAIIGTNRADVRFDGTTLKLLAGTGPGAMASTNGISINTAGEVTIGSYTGNVGRLDVGGGTLIGVSGSSNSAVNEGVRGFNGSTGTGVAGYSTNGIGAVGSSFTGTGVFAHSASGTALKIDGNAAQNLNGNGLVKAMVLMHYDGTIPSLVRCYNGVTGSSSGNCGFSYDHYLAGLGNSLHTTINFGFQVNNRFISLTPFTVFRDAVAGVSIWSFPNAQTVDVRNDYDFYVIVY